METLDRRSMLALVVSLLCINPLLAEQDPVFDVEKILARPQTVETLGSSVKDGLTTEEVRYRFEFGGGRSMSVYGHFIYPEGARMLPAILYPPVSMSPLDSYYPEVFAKRGYAVLAIDFPSPGTRTEGDFPEAIYELGDDIDPQDSPVYFGAVAMLQAVSFLRDRPEVDPERIGVWGAHFGGFMATLLIGLDSRLAAGASLFGTGHFHLGNLYWGMDDQERDEAFREEWAATLDPATRLADAQTPIAWFTGSNDQFYWLPSLMKTYEAAAGEKLLCVLPNFNQALTPQLDEQAFVWMDVHLKGERPLNAVGDLAVEARDGRLPASWPVTIHRDAAAAEVAVSFGGPGNWASRYWHTLPARIEGGRATAALPATRTPYYVIGAVIDGQGFRTSTPWAFVEPAGAGVEPKEDILDFDGAVLWGAFEEPQAQFLQLTAMMPATFSDDAHAGRQSLSLQAGAHPLGFVLFAAGRSYRLTAFAKAERPTTVKVEMLGSDENAGPDTVVLAERSVEVGTEWTKIEIECTPSTTVIAFLRPRITVPEGAAVLIDSVTLRPVLADAADAPRQKTPGDAATTPD